MYFLLDFFFFFFLAAFFLVIFDTAHLFLSASVYCFDLLGRPAQATVGTVDWVRQHRLLLQEALHKAFDRLNRAAAEMAHFTDE